MKSNTTKSVDLSGLRCPLPVLRTKKAMSSLEPGETVEIITTDPSSEKDIPALAELAGYELVSVTSTETGFKFILRK